MNSLTRRFYMIGLALLAALIFTALAQTAGIQSAQQSNLTGAALILQTTPTPQPEDLSEIGSTDGIAAMGGVIALIIFIPILARYKYWARPSPQ